MDQGIAVSTGEERVRFVSVIARHDPPIRPSADSLVLGQRDFDERQAARAPALAKHQYERVDLAGLPEPRRKSSDPLVHLAMKRAGPEC